MNLSIIIPYTWYRTSYLYDDGSWRSNLESNKDHWIEPWDEDRFPHLKRLVLPFTYVSDKYGFQHTEATIFEYELEIRPKHAWLRHFTWLAVAKKYATIHFKEPICDKQSVTVDVQGDDSLLSTFMKFKYKPKFD